MVNRCSLSHPNPTAKETQKWWMNHGKKAIIARKKKRKKERNKKKCGDHDGKEPI
jgi:hypothetical protein